MGLELFVKDKVSVVDGQGQLSQEQTRDGCFCAPVAPLQVICP